MKNFKRRATALILIAALVLTIAPSAFARSVPASDQNQYQYFSSIVTFGDSNAMGYNLKYYKGDPTYPESRDSDDEYDGEYTDTEARYLFGGVPGSFPQIVAETLGVSSDRAFNISYPGFRSKEMLYFLGGNVDMTGDVFFKRSYEVANRFNHSAIDSHRNADGTESGFDPEKSGTMGKGYAGGDVGDFFINKLKSGDEHQLVVIYAGAADVMFAPLEQILTLLDTEDIPGSIAKIVKALSQNYKSFTTNVPKLIKRVRQLNPDCTIALLGTFNPLKNFSISDDRFMPVFNKMTSLTDDMNRKYKKWAALTTNCHYVDITNVETGTLDKGITVKGLIESLSDPVKVGYHYEDLFHATTDGYKYIARQITDKFLLKKQCVGRNIVVDMGSIDNVNSVKLNGKTAKFSFNEVTKKLTVSNKSILANKLIVNGEKCDENGNSKDYIFVYDLFFSVRGGYIAKEVYATNEDKISIVTDLLKKLVKNKTNKTLVE